MSSIVSFAKMVRVLALAIPCLIPLLSGCDLGLEAYPTNLFYPLRSDPIVAQPPGSTTWDTIAPGQLDKHIAELNQHGGVALDPHDLSDKDRQTIEETLQKIFGTPAEPTVNVKDEEELIAALKLDKETLAKGSVLYRRQCMHCHGISGDGRGPTGPWVNPTPRDFRQGYFKFISTATRVGDRKPRREDIRRTLDRGIEGTSMPSFGLMEDHEKEEIVSYVIHLSLRGEAEIQTMMPLLKQEALDGTVAEKVQDMAALFLKAWADSDKEGIEPSPYPYSDKKEELAASIQRGYKLFTDPRGAGSCIGCHVDFGRQAPFRYDFWGTMVRPANLTSGVYRGGRRPLDLYWRIRGGIRPSNMPAADLKVDKANKIDQYWDLVNFLQTLPYPHMLPNEIKVEIYGTGERSR